MRLGLFGGTFDPVHYGHLLLAESCREACRLDAVWFMPAAHPPHKQQYPLTPASQRTEMLELAIGGNEAFTVSQLEIERGGVSYTVDTLDALRAEQPERELYFLLGADTLADLPHWREPRGFALWRCRWWFAAVASTSPTSIAWRHLVSPARLTEIRQVLVPMPQIELSSREIRRRARAGLSIRYQTPRAVEKYIETSRLYQV